MPGGVPESNGKLCCYLDLFGIGAAGTSRHSTAAKIYMIHAEAGSDRLNRIAYRQIRGNVPSVMS